MWKLKCEGTLIKMHGDSKISRGYTTDVIIPDCNEDMIKSNLIARFIDQHLRKEQGEEFVKVRTCDVISKTRTPEKVDMNVDNVHHASPDEIEIFATLLDKFDVSGKRGDIKTQRKKLCYYYLDFLGLMEKGVTLDDYIKEYEDEAVALKSDEIYKRLAEIENDSDTIVKKKKLSTIASKIGNDIREKKNRDNAKKEVDNTEDFV